MKNIAVLVQLSPALLAKLETNTLGYTINDYAKNGATPKELADSEIILGWSRDILAALEMPNKIKWIQIWFAGTDNLPLDILEKKAVLLTTASGANAPSIAQQALMFMLMKERSAQETIANQLLNNWHVPAELGEITNKTLLLIGTGNIGKQLAKYAAPYSMEVIGINTTGTTFPDIKTAYKIDDFAIPIKQADFIVNSLPLTEKTNQLVNKTWFSQMKKTALYISVGRGLTTVTKDLVDSLEQHFISGAVLDVVENEPLPKESPLWQIENMTITPHISGHTNLYDERIIDIFLTNFALYHQGLEISTNLVDYDKGY